MPPAPGMTSGRALILSKTIGSAVLMPPKPLFIFDFTDICA